MHTSAAVLGFFGGLRRRALFGPKWISESTRARARAPTLSIYEDATGNIVGI